MSRDVCGICWCPYDDEGRCGCKPAQVLDKYSLAKIKDDEALLRQALDVLENHTAIEHPQQIHYRDAAIDALKERLK
jgi:hypothetical protein